MTVDANASSVSAPLSIRLTLLSSVSNPDSTTVNFRRSDTVGDDTVAMDAGLSDDDIKGRLQTLAQLLVNQNAASAEVEGEEFTGTADSSTGTVSVTIMSLKANSHADSLGVRYQVMDTLVTDTIPANTTSTSDDLRTILQDKANVLAQQAADAATAARGLVGFTVTATA